MSEACIEYQGKIELMAMTGCHRSASDDEIMMFGIWKKKDNTNEKVCWKFDRVIFIYTNETAMKFQPTDLKIDCDAVESIQG